MWFFILLQQHVIHPRPGWCELDPQLLIKDIREVCNECIKGELEVSPKKLRTFQSIILACAFVWDVHVSGSCVIISHYTLCCLGWNKVFPLLPVLSQPRQWTPSMALISLSTFLLHFILGLLFLSLSGVQWSVVLVIVCDALPKTCPSHLHHDDSIHVFLLASPEQVFIGDLLWSEYPKNSAKT